VLSEINVVPLVDVMLVLLIIFMVAAPMMQRGLEVNLPEARHADQISSERVFVTIPLSFRTDQMLQVDEESIRFEVLSALMQQEMEGRSDRQVFVRGDGGVTFQELVSVMDALKDGGVENVGLITDPLPER
jgi:biopolymer transport protein ExbD